MQFTVNINQAKALEWELNAQQAMLFAFVYECPSWTKPVTTDEGVFFALSKAKIVEELPLLTDKPDTAYRLLKALEGKGVIELSSTNSITLVRLTEKGKTWNKKQDGTDKYPSDSGRKKIRGGSEKSPSQVGKISEAGSEKSPTNQDTSNQDTNQDTSNQESGLPEWLPAEQWKDFVEHRKGKKSKLTELAAKKIISKLDKLRQEGNDLAAVLDQSVANDWTGVFPVKTGSNVHAFPGKPRPVHTGLANANDAGLQRRADGAYSL
ncbi:hypothetical protein [Halomonas sp. N3-2A]|uniref:hypothetical protein n=1 Tax=Halomonas sp. N3-2A TaxID=2014541 RepID=UPI0018DF7FF0|nr:hypothetical protein [Halomonas sp. N3-2A]